MHNQVKITIGGQERELIASMQNAMSIERELGCSIFKILAPYLNQGKLAIDLTFEQMTVIIFNGLRGLPNNTLQRDSIQNELMKEGYVTYLDSCLAYLLSCVTGSKKKEEATGNLETTSLTQ